MRFLSLFAGIGGFDLGLERAGMECVGQAEIDPYCRGVLANHWPDVWRAEDVRTVSRESFVECGERSSGGGSASRCQPQLPVRPDLICGGFPCQDVSVAGKRAGLDGARSGLWFEFQRILSELRPRWAVIENVAGLLSGCGCALCEHVRLRIRDHRERCGGPCACVECRVGPELLEAHSGHSFGIVLAGLAQLGFGGIGWAVLDSQHFGVAQRRRRVFVVCGPTRRSVEQVLSLCESCGGHSQAGRAAGESVAGEVGVGVANAVAAAGPPGTRRDDEAGLIAAPLGSSQTSFGGHRNDLDNETYIPDVSPALTQRDYESQREDIAEPAFVAIRTAQTSANDLDSEGMAYTLDGANGQAIGYTIHGTDKTRRVASQTAVAGAIRTKPPGSQENSSTTVALSGASVRRLTPTEAARLQAFPDDWLHGSDAQKYRALGNAVTVSVAEYLGRRIMAVNA